MVEQMNLIDNNFPEELLERCKTFSGQSTGTKAVRESLQRLFEIEREFRSLKLKYEDLQADFDDIRRHLEQKAKILAAEEKLLKQFREPNRFRLHGG